MQVSQLMQIDMSIINGTCCHFGLRSWAASLVARFDGTFASDTVVTLAPVDPVPDS